jgi:hypothetical protein
MEKISGVISLAIPGPGIFGGYWALYFTDTRILVVEMESIINATKNLLLSQAGVALATEIVLSRVTRLNILKLAGGVSASAVFLAEWEEQIEKQVEISKAFVEESPENLLSLGKKNFQISYDTIKNVVLKRAHWGSNKISIQADKNYNYGLMDMFGGVSDKGFDDYANLLKKLFPGKLEITKGI